MLECKVRKANSGDIISITEIYNQGIEDKIATLESRLRTTHEMLYWLEDREEKYDVLVLEHEKTVVGWASINPFNSRCAYATVADISIYISRQMRGKGLGKLLLNELCTKATELGFHKLVLATFSENFLGKGLYKSVGFREVGTYEKHGRLDGKWIDITIMEKILI